MVRHRSALQLEIILSFKAKFLNCPGDRITDQGGLSKEWNKWDNQHRKTNAVTKVAIPHPPLSTDLIPLLLLGSSSSHTLVWSFLGSLRVTTSACKLTALTGLATNQGPTCDFFALSWYNYQIAPPSLFQSRGLQASSPNPSGPLLAGCHRGWWIT